MRRRAFITLFAGAAVARPLAVRAQQTERMRRIGVLMAVAADDPEGQARVTMFAQALQQLGWTDGRNMPIDVRWGAVDADRYRKDAEELVALAPDVILAGSSAALAPCNGRPVFYRSCLQRACQFFRGRRAVVILDQFVSSHSRSCSTEGHAICRAGLLVFNLGILSQQFMPTTF